MASKELLHTDLPPWQWADYGALNAAQNKPSENLPVLTGNNKNFGTQVINQGPPKYVSSLMKDEFGALISDNIENYREASRNGIDYLFAMCFKFIRKRDMRLGGLLRKRKAAILNEQFNITVKDWEEGKKYIEEIFEDIKNILYDFYSACVEADLQGIKMFEINYIYKNGKTTIGEIRPIDNSLYLYDSDTREYSIMDTSKQSVYDIYSKAIQSQFDKVQDIPKQEIHPMKLLKVFGLDNTDECAFMNGLREALMFAYFHKSYNWKDMQIFIERYASPLMDISYDSVNETVKSDAVRIAQTAKAHGYVIRPKDALTFAYIESQNKSATIDVFMKPINYTDTEMSILVNGEADTTNVIGKNGSKSAMETKKDIADYIKISDLKIILTGGNQLIKNIIDLKFANPPEYPQLSSVRLASVEDQKTESETLKNISDAGYEVPEEEVAKRFNYETVTKKTAPEVKPADPKVKASRIDMSDVDLFIQKFKS